VLPSLLDVLLIALPALPRRRSYVVSDAPQELRWTELKGCQSERPLLTLPSNTSWVKLNAQQYGFYRAQYAPSSMWQTLADAAR
jgi:hypothetical protein